MSEGSLVVLKKNGSEGSKYPMEKENKYILGPGADCHLRFNVENYSQNICEISTNKKLATITKLSLCPILLNNNEIKTPKSLKYGDVIKIGPKTFKWSSLIRRESFTRNVFKNSSSATKSSASKSKRRSSLSDFRGSGLKKLNTWRETDENVQITSSEHQNVKRMSSSSTKSTKIEQKSSGKSKTVPKNYGTLNKTPKALAVVKSLDFRTRSAGKKISPAKKKYFDPNNKTSKIPRIFFPDHSKAPKLSTNKSPKIKTFEEFKENFKTPTTEPKKRKSTRISLELNSNAQITLTEANVRTPDSLGVKPETPNIKLVKSVNKKNASLKKSLDNITMAKKRKISNVTTEDSFVSKKFKLDENEESLIQDETMGSLFDSSLSFLESFISSRRSNRNSLPIVSSPISPKQFDLHNVSGIKSFTKTPNMKSPVNFNSAVKLSTKARQSLQLNSPKNEVVKRRFTESNLISSQTSENEIRIIKPIFSTPKAQSLTIDLPIEEKVRKSVGRPVKNSKISSLIKETKDKRSPGRPRKSEIRTVLKSSKKTSNVSGRKSMLRTSGSPVTSPKNKSIQEIIVKSTPGNKSRGRPKKSGIQTVLQSPKNYILNESARKSILSFPESSLTSPKNKSIQKVIIKSTPGNKRPGRPRKSDSEKVLQSPKNYVLNVSGRKSMLSTSGSPVTSSKNKSIQEVIVTSTPGNKSPGRPRKSAIETVLQSPNNYVLNVSGRKSMLSTPGSPLTSSKNKSIQEIIVKSTPGYKSPGRPRKSGTDTVLQSPKNFVLNVSGRKSMLSTPGSPLTSPKNKSIQEIIFKSTPGKKSPGRPKKSDIETVLQSPKNYVLNVSGRKSMFSIRGSPLTSPKNKSIQEVIVKSTPGKESPGRPRKSDIETVLQSRKNYVLNVSGRKSMLSTPGSPLTSPKNKSIQEVIVKSTPGKKSPGRPRKSDIETVLQSPKNYVLNVSGRKSVLSTPGSPLTSPKNKSIQEAIIKSTPGNKSPGRPRKSDIETVLQSPNNYVLNVSGRKSMLSTPGSPLTSPKNKSIQEVIVKSTPGKKSPGRPRKSDIETVLQSPKNYVLNVSGKKSVLSTPGSPLTSPKNKSIQEAIIKSTPGNKSPGRPRKSDIETVLQSPNNYVLNVSGRKSVLNTPGSPLTSPKNKSIQEAIVKSTPGNKNPGRPRKSEIELFLQSPKNIINVSERSMLSTPGSPMTSPKYKSVQEIIVKRTPGRPKTPKRNQGRPPKSPKNDLTNVAGVKKLLRTPGRPPKSPKNDLTNIVGVKKLLGTPGRPPKSPKNDLTNIAGVKKLLGTPGRPPKSPKNDLTNIAGVKKLLGTPSRPPKSPKNDLTNIAGVKKLLGTPDRPLKSPKNDLTNIPGVKKLLKTPGRPPKSPKNDLTNIVGVKHLLRTPGHPPKSPKNDLNDIYGVRNLFRSPGRTQKSPKNDLTNVRGVKNLLRSPGRPRKSPKNDLSNVSGVKNLLRSPGRPPKSPKNELSNISGIKLMFASPEIQNSPRCELKNNSPLISIMKTPKNKLSNVFEIKSIVSTPQSTPAVRNDPDSVKKLHKRTERKSKTPRKQNEPKNNLSDVEGVASLFNTSKLNSPTNNMDLMFDHLKDENNDTLNLSFTINSKSPLRTYERKIKSLSPEKPKLFECRKSLREFSGDSKKKENVQKWLNEYVLHKEKSPENINIPIAKKSLLKELRKSDELTSKNKRLALKTNELTPSSPTTRSRRLKKVENEENIAPNKILTTKNKNPTNNLTPSSPKTRSRRLKKVENEENIPPEQEKVVSQSPKLTKTRRTRKNVEETEAPTQKETRRGKNAAKTTEEIVETSPKGRTTRKRTKKDEQTTENVETTESVAAKRPRKNKVVKQVQLDVSESEEKKEIPKNKRGGSRKKLKEETDEITSPVRPTRTRGRKAQTINEIETTEEPVEKKTITRSRRGKKIEEIKDDSVIEEITKEPAKKATRNARSKKNEETVEETKEVPTIRTTRKKIAENGEQPLKKETKTTTRQAGRQKKEVQPEKELEETRPTKGKRQKNEIKDDEIRESEVKTRSTRGKKKIFEETTEPVRKITRSRRK